MDSSSEDSESDSLHLLSDEEPEDIDDVLDQMIMDITLPINVKHYVIVILCIFLVIFILLVYKFNQHNFNSYTH